MFWLQFCVGWARLRLLVPLRVSVTPHQQVGKVSGFKDYFDGDQIEFLDRMIREELDPIFGYRSDAYR